MNQNYWIILVQHRWSKTQNKVMKIVREYEQSMKEQSGIPSSMQDNDIRIYMDQILQEVKQKKE